MAILEASDRVGGRVHTWRSPTGIAVVELGAQWIQNAGKKGKLNPIYTLAKSLHIDTVINECVLAPWYSNLFHSFLE